jgi:hypothetical protein
VRRNPSAHVRNLPQLHGVDGRDERGHDAEINGFTVTPVIPFHQTSTIAALADTMRYAGDDDTGDAGRPPIMRGKTYKGNTGVSP